jgi:tRNA (pseudouridine54-N1)-methyltransferase
MRIFVMRARKATVNADKMHAQIGSKEHFEIIAHTLANAFYFSKGMRANIEVYIVLDSAADFPRTLKFSSKEGLSFPGFHENAILEVVYAALSQGHSINKDQIKILAPGITIYGFGFDVLMQKLQEQYPVYLLDKKGTDIRSVPFGQHGVFILSDHLPMPKNSIKVLIRRGLTKICLGPKMLFASQCIVLVHNELDRQFS